MRYKDIIYFLRDANENNNKEWFLENKARYEDVRTTLSNFLWTISEQTGLTEGLPLNPRSSIAKIHNDQRFRVKPYMKNKLWINIKKSKNSNLSFFVEFNLKGIRIGMGYYHASPSDMAYFRRKIDSAPRKIEELISNIYKDRMIYVRGSEYKRRYQTQYSEELNSLYNLSGFYMEKEIEETQWEDLEQITVDTFRRMLPLYLYMVE